MTQETFIVTDEHIKLLRNAYVRWDDCEYGAPAIDPKRPYGNSSVEEDIINLLGWEKGDRCPHCNEYLEDISDDLLDSAYTIHCETQTALQIFLFTGEMKPGCYRKVAFRKWELVC